MIHIVKNAITCRKDQFGRGMERCVGIDKGALLSKREYTFKLDGVTYSGESTAALEYSEAYNSVYVNKGGKEVVVLPVRFFTEVKCAV